MTKLYHGAEGWQIPGQQDKKAERVDIPTAPAELAAWLNERHVWAIAREIDSDQVGMTGDYPDLTIEELEQLGEGDPQLASERKPMAPGFCPECGLSRAGALKLGLGNDVAAIEEWVATAEPWALQRVADAIAGHVRALNEQLDERTVQ
jgi:hypothetical protein